MNVRKPGKYILAMLALFVVAGCVTTQKIDWPSRVGHYTYDQAVAEFGKPGDTTRSADGGTIAIWMIQHGRGAGSPAAPGGYAGPLMPTMGAPYSPSYYMRLVFGPDGWLKEHREFAK